MTTQHDLARDGKLSRPDPLLPHGSEFVLTLSCDDQIGIVHAVSGFLVNHACNILDSAQFGDPDTNRFFMRVAFVCTTTALRATPLSVGELRAAFAPIAGRFAMTFEFRDSSVKPRVLIMVSRHGHCLNDLLFRFGSGELPVDIPAVISNHPDFAQLTESYGVPFYHLPVSRETAAEQEARMLDLVRQERVDLVVLARYMQVLSEEACAALAGRAINIHHSFLPSFKGAKPYAQAYARGVKLIGATAHYVTSTLDEGPIIEQDVARVDHAAGISDLVAIGRDVECMVLARAVKLHVAQRVLPNGPRTVVFR
ncbi:MAG TPA: formyltetrahydrofolate deformylase [Candidatus Acidoferrales bacterium]|nr:formyltetrahydrofolate deformylase [Candidatus Acidoferrales bacterium]